MLIGKEYKIETDSMNVTLFKRKVVIGNRGHNTKSKAGDIYWYPVAYFSDPHHALQYLVKNELMEDGFKDFETVCQKLTELYGLINSLKGLPQL